MAGISCDSGYYAVLRTLLFESLNSMYIRNTAYIPQNWKDIRIADINKLSKISPQILNKKFKSMYCIKEIHDE